MNHKTLNNRQKTALWEHLRTYLSAGKQALFAEKIQLRTNYLTIITEDVYYEQNTSSIIRTAECLGIQSLHIIESENPYKIASGISRNAEKWLTTHKYLANSNQSSAAQACLQHLQLLGYQIVATTPHPRGVALPDFEFSQKTALAFGGEKYGLSAEILDSSDKFLQIPMQGFTESLNISVSTGIILYELSRKLRQLPANIWQLTPDDALDCQIEWAINSIPHGEKIAEHYYKTNLLDK
ncbi:MAG: RNA methyltransferase [Microscillaceae bacterium]|jgi:tRNA (guanosine-2'-O-)-methyltransferase|nr:RNA methyltransferase [Microscillaceae bacterium]